MSMFLVDVIKRTNACICETVTYKLSSVIVLLDIYNFLSILFDEFLSIICFYIHSKESDAKHCDL